MSNLQKNLNSELAKYQLWAADQMKIYALINQPNFWGKISRNSKYKYKNMVKNISPINLGNQLREQFKAEENRLEYELNFWLGE